MQHYTDRLETIFHQELFTDKLKLVYEEINTNFPDIKRVALALYDQEFDILKTYTHHGDIENSLSNYQSKLSDSASLQKIKETGQARIINDLSIFDHIQKHHTIKIKSQGFKSSYTYPIFDKTQFYGFIFINSTSKNTFTHKVLEKITPLIHLIASFTIVEINTVKALSATIKTTLELTHHRDPETGQHLARMARYSRLIAMKVAPLYNISDEMVEHIYLFAPLHDVGKIAIPDKILFKPVKLTKTEFQLMKTHTTKGLEIVNNILKNYQLDNFQHIEVLKNIVKYHHEKTDGSGYPDGLTADEIPVEAKIVAVADIFDALTSNRPYKAAWSNQEAFAEIEQMKGKQLDAKCVEALIDSLENIEQIQSIFVDEYNNSMDI